MPMNAELMVVLMIRGDLPAPRLLRPLVEVYREYAVERGECVSYPRGKDKDMDQIFDQLVEEMR